MNIQQIAQVATLASRALRDGNKLSSLLREADIHNGAENDNVVNALIAKRGKAIEDVLSGRDPAAAQFVRGVTHNDRCDALSYKPFDNHTTNGHV